MNWQQVTQSFLPLSREQTSSFAPPREVDLAIATYNRAIRNLNQDSADIALIALRKLASDYPDFLEASLLYGCCLAQVGQLSDARDQLLKTARHPELPGDLDEAAQAALKAVDRDIAEQAAMASSARPANGKTLSEFGTSDLPVRPADAVLEKTGRRARVRMASERERRDIMRRSDMPQDEETHVVMSRNPMDFLRIALPVVGALVLIVLIIYVATRLLPGLQRGPDKASPEERLAYLLAEIEKKAPASEEWQQLLSDYQGHFDPTPTPAPTTSATAKESTTTASTESSSQTTESQMTTTTTVVTTPATTPLPTASPAELALQSAVSLYEEAIAVKDSDLITASENLHQAIALLNSIPAETATVPSSASSAITAGALLIDANAAYEPIYRYGADELRILAEPHFEKGEYQEALSYYLRAYAMYPGSYGGGVAYYIGRCYQLMDQPDQARPYYEYVIANFAGRSIAISAASRLASLD